MPGNKNSGRKKSVKTTDLEISTPVVGKRKAGRPPKIDTQQSSEHVEKNAEEIDSELAESQSEISSSVSSSSSSLSLSHHSNLQKRSSEISKMYDLYVGVALEMFPSSRLPLQRTVLQRYRHFRSFSAPNSSLNEIVTIITKEVRNLWERAKIPMKDYRGCWDIVKQCISNWTNSRKDIKMDSKFQTELNTLLDFRPVNCRSLSTLKVVLKKNDPVNWSNDFDFMEGQLKYPQTTSMSQNTDSILAQRVQIREERAAKASIYKEKNQGEHSCTTDLSNQTISKTTFSKSSISEENVIEKTKRQCTSRTIVTQVDSSDDDTQLIQDTSDDEWELPLRKKREIARKPVDVTLTLPAKSIPTVLAATCTTTRTSSRNEMKLVSTLLKAGGADLNNVSLSVSTIKRQRRRKIELEANVIRDSFSSFKDFTDTFLVLHFDGKIIMLMDKKTEDRLAIAVSSPGNLSGQFIASPAISNGTGDTMAKCVFKIVNDYQLIDSVHALVFDTTASNTGKWSGASTIFGLMLERPLLWLACRHHVCELFIKHANIAIRGETKGPDDPLFKELQKLFSFIDLDKRTLWKWPKTARDWRHRRANEVLLWADHHMQKATWPREDYRELLELVTVYLGGVVKRVHGGQATVVQVQIRKPGALHRARFMASSLYLLKICLFQDQFPTERQNIDDAMILVEYIALLHTPYFLKCPLAIPAPRNDRDFWVDLVEYKKCFRVKMRQSTMIEAIQKSVLNHLWYLSEELVIFALFDDGLNSDERCAMAAKLYQFPNTGNIQPEKPVFPVDLMVDNPRLDSFVGPKSWLLFNMLNAGGAWLQLEVDQWNSDVEYARMKNCLEDLKVVNDVAERCIKDIQEYADLAKDSQYKEDILIVATDHRAAFQDLSKRALSM